MKFFFFFFSFLLENSTMPRVFIFLKETISETAQLPTTQMACAGGLFLSSTPSFTHRRSMKTAEKLSALISEKALLLFELRYTPSVTKEISQSQKVAETLFYEVKPKGIAKPLRIFFCLFLSLILCTGALTGKQLLCSTCWSLVLATVAKLSLNKSFL